MLDELIEKYKKFNAKLIVLFGSRARGDYTDESDIDILVVADDLPKDPREAFDVLRDPRFPLVNPIGMNTEVFLKKLHEGNTFVLEILEDGKILYYDKSFLEQVRVSYKEIRKKYLRRGKTWIRLN
ncbi:MAG: nucleotidyltransferase domain-containing protein [Thermoprotei archaeon]